MYVCATGITLTQIHTPNGGLKDIWGVKEASEIAVAPVLLNKQVGGISLSLLAGNDPGEEHRVVVRICIHAPQQTLQAVD